MIEGKSILAIIPARGGSKGLPRKNLLEINGKPLLAWTIEEAQKSRYIDRLILSSDNQEIIATGRQWGCEAPYVRPESLATDEATTTDVVFHATTEIETEYDYVVLLQPTSPLRSSDDIDACIEKCHVNMAPSCTTVTESGKSPFWMYFLDENNHMHHVLDRKDFSTRRQELPRVYALNGAVYVVQWEWFRQNKRFIDDRTIAHIMPVERSIDIDTPFDLKIFKALAELPP